MRYQMNIVSIDEEVVTCTFDVLAHYDNVLASFIADLDGPESVLDSPINWHVIDLHDGSRVVEAGQIVVAKYEGPGQFGPYIVWDIRHNGQ